MFQMNTSVSATTKCQPFEVVFGQKAMPNERLLDHLFEQGFVNEEDIPQGLIDDFSYAPGDVSETSTPPAADINTSTAVGEEPSSSLPAVASDHHSSTSVDINTAVGDESTLVMDWPTVDLIQSTTRDDFAPTLEDVVLSFGETTTHDPQDSVCDVATPSPRFTTLKTPKRTSHTSATTPIIPSTPHPLTDYDLVVTMHNVRICTMILR